MIAVIAKRDGELETEEWTDEEKPLMSCGHTANATTTIPPSQEGEPPIKIHCCAICNGKESKTIQPKPPLNDREARCSGCKHSPPTKVDSKWSLPFFQHRPHEKYDTYYCGCWGWN